MLDAAFWRTRWPERIAALASMAGVLWSILINFHVRAWEATGSDFKTMYASAWCLARGLDGYSVSNIARVFVANGVVQPRTWFGHAPVYPPLTLALIAPLTVLPMWVAVYGWVLLSGLALALAAAALARFAQEQFGLGLGWRVAVIVAVVASPLAAFGLALGNVSVVVTSLCIFAVTTPEGDREWPRALSLALALLLKPHMAVWVLAALLITRSGRPVGRQACAYAAGLALALYGFSALQLGWEAGFAQYFAMLHSETANGSMRAGNHELMEAAAQIVSMDSLLGYGGSAALRALGAVLLVAGGALLARATWQIGSAVGRLEAASAWCSLGLIATYHRAADGTMLLMMLPWLASRWRARWWDGWAWGVMVAYAAVSAGLDFPVMLRLHEHPQWGAIEEFFLFRQGALAAVVVAGLLVLGVVRARRAMGEGHA